jgi:serine/threonine protein kinase
MIEHICKVYEVGEVDGHPYIAMELVRGKSLASLQRSLNREQKLTLMRDIAHAVHSAHSLGIIHRGLVYTANTL